MLLELKVTCQLVSIQVDESTQFALTCVAQWVGCHPTK